MTALRYCGGLRIRLTIVLGHEVYRAWITDDAGATYRTDVVAPRCPDHAIDHPASFDAAARAALSFADADAARDLCDLYLMRADMDDSGWIVTRKREGER